MAESVREPGSGEWLASQVELLGAMKVLRRQARAARHGYWFPLLLFGVLTCASIPFYGQHAPPLYGQPASLLYGQPAPLAEAAGSTAGAAGPVSPFLGGDPAVTGGGGLAFYWTAALLGGLLLTQLWYWWHARRAGVATRSRAYFVTMAALTVAAIVVPPLSRLRAPGWLHWLAVVQPGDLVIRGTFPFVIIAASLLALAWAERSPALAVTAVLYTGAAVLASLYDVVNIAAPLGWKPPTRRPGVAECAAARAGAGRGRGGRRCRPGAPERGVTAAGEAPPAAGAASDEYPTNALDETVHQRHRLGILTITAEAKRAEFGYLREALGLTAGNLSRHLTVLEEAGMITVEKGYAGRRPRTWVRITGHGREALAAELSALTKLVRRHQQTSGS
jgi:DNA-binding MarR family transcriptional regulator